MQFTDEMNAARQAREIAYRAGYGEPRKFCPRCLRPISVVSISTARGFEACFRFFIFCSASCETHTDKTVDLVNKSVFSVTVSEIMNNDKSIIERQLTEALMAELGSRK